jgi:hypothetical protein
MRLGRSLVAVACLAVPSVQRTGAAATPSPAAPGAAMGSTPMTPPGPRASPDDLARARVLDQQGVRAFRDGRYNDAIRYFDEAYKLGAPSSELWNIARCYLKLDQPEVANEALERYLAQTDLSAEDRTNARRELEELGHRRSTVTVASSPSGAIVSIDGRHVGRTPASVDVAAGEHVVTVHREGYAPYVERLEARYGRAVIVDARLGDASSGGTTADDSGFAVERHRFTGSAEIAGLFAKLGSVGVPLHPAALVSLAYVPYDSARVDVAVGARLTVTYDSWGNSIGAPALTCGLGGEETAAALAVFADGAIGYRPTPRIRMGADLGFGFASEIGSALGGDVFTPSCTASPGIVPAGHVGTEVSYALIPALRLVVAPIVFEVMPAFSGALDASSVWFRIGTGVGFAVDL